jgi:hypothetical protein
MVNPVEMDIVLVLDVGDQGERFAKCLLELAERHNFTGLRVTLDPLPAMEGASPGSMFAGKLEGNAGKDRSQYVGGGDYKNCTCVW